MDNCLKLLAVKCALVSPKESGPDVAPPEVSRSKKLILLPGISRLTLSKLPAASMIGSAAPAILPVNEIGYSTPFLKIAFSTTEPPLSGHPDNSLGPSVLLKVKGESLV